MANGDSGWDVLTLFSGKIPLPPGPPTSILPRLMLGGVGGSMGGGVGKGVASTKVAAASLNLGSAFLLDLHFPCGRAGGLTR